MTEQLPKVDISLLLYASGRTMTEHAFSLCLQERKKKAPSVSQNARDSNRTIDLAGGPDCLSHVKLT